MPSRTFFLLILLHETFGNFIPSTPWMPPNTANVLPPKITHSRKSVITNANIYFCQGIHCRIVNEFSISDDFTLNCFEEYISIEIDVKVQNETKKSGGYLPNDQAFLSSKIQGEQKTSKICKFIKRYSINDKTILIGIGDYILQLVEREKADSTIAAILWKNWHFFYYFFYFGLYNEDQDSINYFLAFEKSVFGILFSYILIKLTMIGKNQIYGLVELKQDAKNAKAICAEARSLCEQALETARQTAEASACAIANKKNSKKAD